MSLAKQTNLSFDRYMSPSKKQYYLDKGMTLMENLRKDHLKEYLKIIGNDKYIVPCYFRNGNKDNYAIFYGDVKNFSYKGGRPQNFSISKKKKEEIMDYFFSNINNSDREVAEKFGILKSAATFIITKGLEEKWRLLNLRENI